jgi:hypothetical protein
MDFSARLVGLIAYSQDPSTKNVTAYFLNPVALNVTPHLPALAIQSQYVAGGSSPADRSVAVGDYDILVWNLDDCQIDILDPVHTPDQHGVKVDWTPVANLGAVGLRLNRAYHEQPLQAPHCSAAVVMRSGELKMTIETVGSSKPPLTANTGALTVSGPADPMIKITAQDGTVRVIELRQTTKGAASDVLHALIPVLWFSSMPALPAQYQGPTLEIVAVTGLIDWGNVGGLGAVLQAVTTSKVNPSVAMQFGMVDDPELTRCGKPNLYVPLV